MSRSKLSRRNKKDNAKEPMIRTLRGLKSYNKFCRRISPDLSCDHRRLLSKTTLSWCLQLKDFIPENTLLDRLVRCFDVASQCFIVGASPCDLTSEWIHELTGLPSGGKVLNLSSGGSGHLWDYIKDSPKNWKDQKYLEDKILGLIKSKEEQTECVSLIVLYILSYFLFPCSNGIINTKLLPFCEDLDHFKDYDWCDGVRRFLMTSIDRIKNKILQKKNSEIKVTGHIAGCATLIWFRKVINDERSSLTTYEDNCSPRILAWSIKNYLNTRHVDKILRTTSPHPMILARQSVKMNLHEPGSSSQDEDESFDQNKKLGNRNANSSVSGSQYDCCSLNGENTANEEELALSKKSSLLPTEQVSHATDINTGGTDVEAKKAPTMMDKKVIKVYVRRKRRAKVMVEHTDIDIVEEDKEEEIQTEDVLDQEVVFIRQVRPKQSAENNQSSEVGVTHSNYHMIRKLPFIPDNKKYVGRDAVTNDQHLIIEKFLSGCIDSQLLVVTKLVSVQPLHVYNLVKGIWTQDDVIDAAINFLCEDIARDAETRVNCYLVRPWLTKYIGSKRKLSKNIWSLNIEQLDNGELVVIPICSNIHWHVLVLDWAQKKWKHYLSSSGSVSESFYANAARSVMEWVNRDIQDRLGIAENQIPTDFEAISIHQLTDRHDCGIYAIAIMNALVTGQDPRDISQDDMPKIRAQLAVKILSASAAGHVTHDTIT